MAQFGAKGAKFYLPSVRIAEAPRELQEQAAVAPLPNLVIKSTPRMAPERRSQERSPRRMRNPGTTKLPGHTVS